MGAREQPAGGAQPRIVVTRQMPEQAIELLRTCGEVWVSAQDRPLTLDELYEAVAGASAILALLHDRIDGALLDAAGPSLRCVADYAVGYDNVDLAAAAQRGVVICNTPGVLTDATADLAIALMLMVTRRLGEGERLVRANSSWTWTPNMLLGTDLQGKTLGVVGLGGIGAAVARRARAFSMEIAYNGRSRAPAELEAELGARLMELDELCAAADVLTLHCPLTPQTHHLIDARRLRLMRPTAYLVNTARGPVVDEPALVEALRGGVIAGAGLDVYEHEPQLTPGLTECENAVLVPHLGSATRETRLAMAMLAARNIQAVLSGRPALTPVG